MKEKHNIDELFKKGLRDYRAELPSEKTKEKIFGKLSFYHNLKRLSIFIIAILFITGSIWAYQYLISKTKDKDISYQQNSANESKEKEIPFAEPLAVSTASKQDNFNKQQYNRIESSSNVYKNKNIAAAKRQHANTATDNTIPQPESKASVEKPADIPIQKTIETNGMQSGIEASVKAEEIKENKTEEAAVEAKTKDQKENEKARADDLIKKAYKKPVSSRFELLLGATVYFVDKKLSAATEYDNLVKLRKDAEKPIFALSPALELRFNFNKFYIQSGFQYQKYGEKVDFSTSETLRNITENWLHRDTLYYVKDSVNPPGSWHLDTIWFVVKDTNYKTNKYSFRKDNSYKYVEIPFLIGKRFVANNISFEISTGISLGFLLKADSRLLSTDGKTALLISNEKSPYLNSIMVNYLLRFYIRYSISERWSIYISPDMKYNLGNILNESMYPIKQNYMLYGMGSGLIYKF